MTTWAVGLWVLLSAPLALVVGHHLRHGGRVNEASDLATQPLPEASVSGVLAQ